MKLYACVALVVIGALADLVMGTIGVCSFCALGMALQAAQGPLTDRVRPYELLRWEPDQRYSRDAVTIKNPSGSTALAAGGLLVGTPLKKVGSQWTIVLSGDEANTTALFIGDDAQKISEALAANTVSTYTYPILVRGPAIINRAALPALDPNGASYTAATITTALLALSPPITFEDVASNVHGLTVQTT